MVVDSAQRSRFRVPAFWRSGIMEIWQGHTTLGVGRLFTGSARDAAESRAQLIINCANVDYPCPEAAGRFWRNINFKGDFAGELIWGYKLPWDLRLEKAVVLVLDALIHGRDVLVHCRQGRHRSGGFAVLMLALLQKHTSLETSHKAFVRQRNYSKHDQARLRDVIEKVGSEDRLQVLCAKRECSDKVDVLKRAGGMPK